MTHCNSPRSTFLSQLLHDRSGNTLALVAAATAPLVAVVGSAVDIGRGYVTESRLQQACDAGVLGARKKLGSDLPPSGFVLGEVKKVGNELFDLNFPEGRYSTEDRSFVMTLEEDFAISGQASATLPTTIMGIFGKQEMPIAVTCQSRMNFTNLDIMMVLDVTGSMRLTNPGDSLSRIDSMRAVIKGFHADIESAKAPDTRVRYGFVPYATNVNVGGLLKNNWVVNDWTYQTRELDATNTTVGTRTYDTNWVYESGTRSDWTAVSTYAATFYPGTPGTPGTGDEGGSGSTSDSYRCEGSEPAYAVDVTDTLLGESSEPFAGPPAGTREIDHMRRWHNGTRYRTIRDGSTCTVERQVDDNYVQTFDRITDPSESNSTDWRYAPIARDVDDWRSETFGCMEEIDTVQIADYDNVDLAQALDLNIDHVPGSSNAGKWRPMYHDIIYARSLNNSGVGSFTPAEVITTSTYAKTGNWWMSNCPASAVNLNEMDGTTIATYLDTLNPEGATYHDIGMLWGARLLSPDGLFASENADESANKPTTRHLIFLTDGQTEAYDVAYGAYGLEPLDRRRWDPDTSTLTLNEVVEARFSFACNEIKKKNTTVWVIAFGTDANTAMTECAGEGRYFEASNASQLTEAFDSIARSMGDLRVSK